MTLALPVTMLLALSAGLPFPASQADPHRGHEHLPTKPDLVPAAVAAPLAVDRARWTAVASGPRAVPADRDAARAIDGDPATSWESGARGLAGAMPHQFTVDMHAEVNVSGVTYLPPTGDGGDRKIGRYRIDLSTDGTTWGEPVSTGTFADDATLKVAEFAVTPARYVRLTALTEADGGTESIRAAEINVLAAADPALPRTGWTATASSYETVRENTPPSNALDGNTGTFWHTRWSSDRDVPPNDITIDMKATKTVTGLSYLPRQDGRLTGNIGQYRIEVSADGTSWTSANTGTWADTNVVKTVTFAGVSGRYVRLTAIAEAGPRAGGTNAAEINIHGSGTTTTPSSSGEWTSPITFPLVPTAVATLPNGKLLTWSAYKPNAFSGGTGQTVTATYNPSTGSVTQRTVTNTGHDMFCPGVSTLPDGRILVSGGSDGGKSSYYNASTDAWSTGPAMAIARAYQATTTLSDGRVFAIGGSWKGGVGGKNGEVWSAGSGWTKLPNALVANMLTADAKGTFRADNHAWLFAWSGGRVLQAGPSKTMNWYGTSGTGSTTRIGTRASDPDAMNGTAVMYDTGKILTLGGAPSYENSNATANAHVITISGSSTVTARKVASMAYKRAYHNSVVLPDGKVLVLGGLPYPQPFSDNDAVRSPELWDPATERFTTLRAAAVPRTYHSVATLLPDGRVFSGGGGLCGDCAANHFNAEIFTPPYLLNSDGTPRSRPTITTAPATAAAGTTITVGTGGRVSKFSLVRMGTATHSVNTDQRRISVSSGAVTGGYTVHIPSDKGVVLPGNYMLFALDANGTPSVARTIRIT